MKLWVIVVVCCAAATGTFATQVPIEPSPQDWSWQPSGNLETVDLASELQDGSTDAKLTAESSPNKGFFGDDAREQRSVEAVVDEILVSSRQGRNIEGYDQVYADPNVKNALEIGNDTVARSYIRDKLCTLGLMNCENVEGRRPYYSPHRGIYPQDIIYAQPVTIKPVGRPLPAIPVKRPYGPPKIPPGLSGSSSFASSGLTSDVVYGVGGGPVPPPSISHFPGGPGGLIGSYPGGPKKPGPPFPSFAASKPVYEGSLAGSFDYESNDRFIDKKQIALRPGLAGADIQQHVHHHYHHGEGAGQSGGFVGSPSIGLGTVGSSYDPPGQSIYAGGFQESDDYKKAFKVKAPPSTGGNGLIGSDGSASANSYADRYPVYEKPPRDFTYGKTDGQKTGKYYGTGNYASSNAVQAGSNDYSFGSSNVNNNYYNYQNENEEFGNDFTGNYGGGATDCVCVPYEQCQASEHAGRKDDLFLAIDPRNLNKNIEAEGADSTTETSNLEGNGTAIADMPISSETSEVRTKREAVKEEDQTVEGRKKNTGEGRLDASDLDSSKLNLKPTWGISFGLPQTGGGPYPINPYAGNPLVNPYGGYGSGSDQGLNLGLVSVNPLLAVQFSKDEYGDKVVKPFVNFHVTPNRHIVQKLGDLLAHKKQAIYGNYGPGPVYGPGYASHYHHPPKPSVYYEKPNYPPKPFYPSHGPAYHHEPSYPTADYSDYYREGDDYDYDYDDRSYARSNAKQPPSLEKDRSTDGQTKPAPNRSNSGKVSFPGRRKRELDATQLRLSNGTLERQFIAGPPRTCSPGFVCCRRRQQTSRPRPGQCGTRYTQGINGRIKTPINVDGDAEFGEYPWQVAILKKDPTESVYVCGGTLISSRHILTAAHCVKTYAARDLRARLGEWDVNHDVEFYPYIERDVANIVVHPEFYAGTLYNDIAILRIDHEVDFVKNPHISPACLPDKRDDFAKNRCWTTGWGKDAFGDFGKYQNILKEVDVPVVSNQLCEHQMRRTRLGPGFNLHPGFICAGGEEGKDACKGDGGGPMVCERQGRWQLAGIVSWGIGCGQAGVPGVYSRVSHYLDWIQQIVNRY
ncbi:uncharacterized protein LOC143365245 [Halictus rubicundus]|uniref:uncharacterized protein LOC143365245 n=1 Tax=Halictus rubicundus TaxID=77578 RepID=UPI004035A9C9